MLRFMSAFLAITLACTGCGTNLDGSDLATAVQPDAPVSQPDTELASLAVSEPAAPQSIEVREFTPVELDPNPPVAAEPMPTGEAYRVFGADDRRRVNSTTTWPYSAVCKVYAYFPDGSTSYSTGTLVSPRHVLTAAHCVYKSTAGGKARQLKVVPGLSGFSKPFGEAWAVRLWWSQGFDGQTSDNDLALVTLNSDIGNATGWMAFYPFLNLNPMQACTSNYPCDRDVLLTTLGQGYQYTSEGPITASSPTKVNFQFDMQSGASGGPIFPKSGFQEIFAVVSADTDTTNIGCRLNSSYYTLLKIIKDELGLGLHFSASPCVVEKGAGIIERITVATPGAQQDLYWIPPAGSIQGPIALGKSNYNGELSALWDTNQATAYGVYTVWAVDRGTGRASQRIRLRVDPGVTWSASPTQVRKGSIVTERVTRATPGQLRLYWTSPGTANAQGPLVIGNANSNGDFIYSWNTNTATQYGNYVSWVVDCKGRRSDNASIVIQR